MNRTKVVSVVVLVLATLGFLATQTPAVRAQATLHLAVEVTGQSMVAGFNNTMTVTVINDYSGYVAIYDVGITISVPAPLALIGSGSWQFNSIEYGQGVTVSFQVYAPSSAAGSSYAGTLTATYKQLGDISYTSETHSLGLAVTGYINFVLYGMQSTPSEVTAGGNTTLSGNVLNNGNLASYNANVTVESDAILPGSQNSVFLGEVDPNIPRPFSVIILFKPDLPAGNYTIDVTVTATDYNRAGMPIVGQSDTQIQVIKSTVTFTRPTTELGVVGLIIIFFRNLFNAFFGSSTGLVSPMLSVAVAALARET